MTGAKLRRAEFPAGAFGLGIVLFSADMREAFVSGILVILVAAAVSAVGELVWDIRDTLPGWSLRGMLWIGAGAFSACSFELGFYILGMQRSAVLFVMQGVIGVLAAEEIYFNLRNRGAFDNLLWECAIVWALWIIFGILREFLSTGTVFGYCGVDFAFRSGSFQKPMFAFLAAGVVLGLACMILGKTCRGISTLIVVLPAIFYTRPFLFETLGEVFGALAAGVVTLGFFLSVRKQQQDTTRKAALDGIPAELICMGIIYMILSVY
ncbi:hypothetical protein NXH76_20125 [Blautia schinkii]|nr:hypothetical protein [Blautia schinkii]